MVFWANNAPFVVGLIGMVSLEFDAVKNTRKTRYNMLKAR